VTTMNKNANRHAPDTISRRFGISNGFISDLFLVSGYIDYLDGIQGRQ